jgi:ubiquinone biosynthesis protein UbiJ
MSISPLDWKPLAGRALEAALNRALDLDPDTRAALQPLDGRSVVLALDAPAGREAAPLALRMTVADARLQVGPAMPEGGAQPDLAVRSTLGGVVSLGMRTLLPRLLGTPADEADAMPVGRLRIEGDAELARRLQRLAERFDPDWQQPFTRVFGDVIGVQVANGMAAALRGARDSGRRLAETTAEYLTEESRDVVPRAELDAFFDDVDTLRDDAERLAARISRLQKRVAA